eukprot:CAMPEP_0204375702 /NCGR_PEP_ID=MMETSP0469-20131031/49454_1 /ASSEMBLY_ACC=CAM_ASM_000384 /TAXON_ID=2969 /ORGANISM="Oxyrrhis marina" /LENGTH=172 /DNA_ID=CAMNT_0051366429 /DNA_START=17 /DNA_END=535 /DNA_ORIENTATION=+
MGQVCCTKSDAESSLTLDGRKIPYSMDEQTGGDPAHVPGFPENTTPMAAREQGKASPSASAKALLEELVKPQPMNVLTSSGQLVTCSLQLASGGAELEVRVGDQSRITPVNGIEAVFVGTSPPDIPTPLNELCSTLMLTGSGECITFHFQDLAQRDVFAEAVRSLIPKPKGT